VRLASDDITRKREALMTAYRLWVSKEAVWGLHRLYKGS